MEIAKIAENSIPPGTTNAKVERINLKVGKLSAIVADSLTFCFNIIVKENPRLSGASLEIENVPLVVRCKACRKCRTLDSPVFVCRHCQSESMEILSGRELEIASIEIVGDDDSAPARIDSEAL